LSINAILENGKTCECRGRGVRRIWFPLVLYTPRIAQESTTTNLQSDPDIEHAKISVQGR